MDASSRIVLDERALHKNLRFLRKTIGKNVLFSSVIKGNAYGHGIEAFVPMAESCGVRHFSVFTADEALRAHRSRTENSRILVLGFIADEELEWAVELVLRNNQLLEVEGVCTHLAGAARRS